MENINLPRSLVNPFDLRYVRDDLHVIAFFAGHPTFEAVEAMVAFRKDGQLAIRAILTRHDQSQIDHINDLELFNAASSAGRRAIQCSIEASIDLSARLPTAQITFQSYESETVVLKLVCASPPDARRGGISDPGNHSLGSSLPIMLRGKSAMAHPSSHVSFAGVEFLIPEKLRAGPYFTGHDGYFTVSHHMAILRTGSRQLKVLEQPASLQVGERWVYETVEGKRTYVLTSRSTDDQILATSNDGYGETVVATISGNRLKLEEIRIGWKLENGEGVAIKFQAGSNFAISLDQHDHAVVGSTLQASPEGFSLLSQQPPWAKRRPISVRWNESNDEILIETTSVSADEA
jgi:hypothetical protein